ncbi:MAG: serine hydrolase domain-containing protein [Acidimicrobiales bacterium]
MDGGSCDPAFAPVYDAFRRNFVDNGELGASLCVRIDGHTVVDLWGGTLHEHGGEWGPSTLVNSFSVGKGVTAILAMLCVDGGTLDYGDAVHRWWPEFAGGGKETLAVSDILGHRAGLPALRADLDDEILFDWDRMCTLLASESPWWEPASAHGYHVNTFGFLVGEVLRRATGTALDGLLRQLLPGGSAEGLHFGVPTHLHGSVASTYWSDGPRAADTVDGTDESADMYRRAHANPPGISGVGLVNTARWRSAVLPSTNLHASARGVCAAFESAGADRVSREVLSRAVTETSNGTDRLLGRTTRFGHGFQLPIPERGFGPEESAFGHYGAGGSLGFRDPVRRVSFGYVMNRMGRGWQNTRNRSLVEALYACL